MKKNIKWGMMVSLVLGSSLVMFQPNQTSAQTTINNHSQTMVLAATKTEKGDVKKGAKIYKQNCAVCHGKTGKADGPAGKALKPSPRDFTKGKFKYSKNDAELLAFIKKGKPPMPSWEKKLNDQQIQDVIAFIHSLKKN